MKIAKSKTIERIIYSAVLSATLVFGGWLLHNRMGEIRADGSDVLEFQMKPMHKGQQIALAFNGDL